MRIPIAMAVAAAACGTSPPEAMPVCGDLQVGNISNAQCGATLDFTPINSYHGAIPSIQDREDAVALINGNCTGTLIEAHAGPVLLTAGHCVGLGDRALVAFNVEDQPDGDRLVTSGVVIEQSNDPDYALIDLDLLPKVTPSLLTSRSSDLLAIIQHPRGRPKVIAEGKLLGECGGVISYTNLDTEVGSSGAGVLTQNGYLIGVHTDGDCTTNGGGSNRGYTAASIIEASAYLQAADIADR